MTKSSLLVPAVALLLIVLAPTTASAGGVRVYVGPGYGYSYPRYSYDCPRSSDDKSRDSYNNGYPRAYTVYRVPRRVIRRQARRYWRGW